jgi:hypothetical protein
VSTPDSLGERRGFRLLELDFAHGSWKSTEGASLVGSWLPVRNCAAHSRLRLGAVYAITKAVGSCVLLHAKLVVEIGFN